MNTIAPRVNDQVTAAVTFPATGTTRTYEGTVDYIGRFFRGELHPEYAGVGDGPLVYRIAIEFRECGKVFHTSTTVKVEDFTRIVRAGEVIL